MNLIRLALRKPISIMVMVLGLLFFGVRSAKDIQVDILPEMNLPVVYIAHSFNGYTPQQMEGYFTKMYVNMMLFTNGIKSIESKNTQGLTLMKVNFYEGTDMGEALAQLNALSNRSQVFLPPGTPPPFIIRFDASSQPVGQLVFRSPTKTNNQLQDIANFTARPFLIAIPGLTTAPPFGGSPRTIEINVDPNKLRAHQLSPEQIVEANAVDNFEETKVQLSAAQLAYKQHAALYENGLTTLVDYTQALYSLNRAEIDYEITQNNVWQALLLLASAQGNITVLTQ